MLHDSWSWFEPRWELCTRGQRQIFLFFYLRESNQNRLLSSRWLCSLQLIYSLACAVCVKTDNIVLQVCVRQLHDPCSFRGADTAVDSHKRRCPRAGGPEEPMFSTPLTPRNWTRCGALRHSGLDGTAKKNGRGQQHFHTGSTSECWLCVDTGT